MLGEGRERLLEGTRGVRSEGAQSFSSCPSCWPASPCGPCSTSSEGLLPVDDFPLTTHTSEVVSRNQPTTSL